MSFSSKLRDQAAYHKAGWAGGCLSPLVLFYFGNSGIRKRETYFPAENGPSGYLTGKPGYAMSAAWSAAAIGFHLKLIWKGQCSVHDGWK